VTEGSSVKGVGVNASVSEREPISVDYQCATNLFNHAQCENNRST